MSAFFDNSITDGGRQLYAEMQAGGTFVPTRIVIGSGYLPTGKTTRTVTSVAEPVKSIELNKKEKLNDGDFVIGGVFTNEDITAAFYYRELALYAKVVRADETETAETLYSYGNAGANAELIPAYSTDTAIERQLDILTYIGNDAVVKIEVESGVYVSKNTYDADMATVKRNIKNGILIFEDVYIEPSAFAEDTTYTDYPYRAAITCAGVTADYIPDVIFGKTDSESGNFAAMSDTASNAVYIYAKQKPAATITLLTIECRKAVTK